MAVKYFNINNLGIIDSKREIYQSDVSRIVNYSTSKRKITDVVFTNEMAGTNMNNIQTDAMEFQVGGFNPIVNSIFCNRLFDPAVEDLGIEIQSVTMNSPIRYTDVIINIRDKMNFLLDGGTDCILVYIIEGTVNNQESLGANWDTNTNVLVLPILSSRHQFDILLRALYSTLLNDGSGLDEENKVKIQNNESTTRVNELRRAWKEIIDEAYSKHVSGTNVLPDNCNIYMIDFFNKISIDGADLLRHQTTGLLNIGEHLIQVNLRKIANLYEEKSSGGGISQNELGAFFASSLGCSEGIYYPQFATKPWRSSKLMIASEDREVRTSISSFLLTIGGIITTTTTNTANDDDDGLDGGGGGGGLDGGNSDAPTTSPITLSPHETHVNIYKRYLPQYFEMMIDDKSVSVEGHIPLPLENSNLNLLKKGLARFYPFFWIAREDAYSLGAKELLNIWNTRSLPLQQVINIYGYYGIQNRGIYEKEEPIDYSNLFGECSMVIPQARALKHNMRIQNISGVIKFDSLYDNVGERYYIPRLLTPTILNIWNNESSLVTPMEIYILTQKFGSKPPFHPGSKLNIIACIYAYTRNDGNS